MILPALDCQNTGVLRRNQERVKSILLLAIPDEYLLKFHNVADAKSLWEAIKSRFGGNIESKKIQLEVHGSPYLKEDINQSSLVGFLLDGIRFPSIMRNKPDIDEIDIDDLYNNLRVYEDELKSLLLLAKPTTILNLRTEDFFALDGDDLEELDLRWKVAMLTVRIECYNCHRKGHFARECRSRKEIKDKIFGDKASRGPISPITESSSQALVAQDGLGGYDWSNDFEVEPVNYAFMAISSSISSSSSAEKGLLKERDELKGKIAKWEESTKNLDEILNSQMSARDKTGLGYSTQLNELSSNHETDSENSLSIFDVRSSDEENTPENDRFLKNGPNVSTARPVYATRPTYLRMDNVRPEVIVQPFKSVHRALVNTGKGKWLLTFKKSRWVGGSGNIYLDHVSKNSSRIILLKKFGQSGDLVTGIMHLLSFLMKACCTGVLVRDDVYSLDLKNIVPSGGNGYHHKRSDKTKHKMIKTEAWNED
ncbi:putative ribonuclease H-like domain-containing protein [Tanacetum coccineum]